MSIEQERRIEELEKLLSEAQTRQSIAWPRYKIVLPLNGGPR